MSYTPGPWSISEVPCGPGRDGYAAIDAKDRWYALAEVVVVFEGEDFEPGRANARLIAAAPELLEALLVALAHVTHEECCTASEATKDAMRGIANGLRTAIAKATGERCAEGEELKP